MHLFTEDELDPGVSHVEAAEAFIVRYRNVSLVELLGLFRARGMETDGEYSLPIPENPRASNVFVWFNLSEDAIDALVGVFNSDVVMADLADPLIYCFDGAVPNVPVVKSLRHYKDPRWAPVVLVKRTRPRNEVAG